MSRRPQNGSRFFDSNGSQKPFLVLFGIFAPLLVAIAFGIWGIKLTYKSIDNTAQIDTLSKLTKETQKMAVETQKSVKILEKIYNVSDSTNKLSLNLKKLPEKFSELSSTLDVLNGTLKEETKKINKSYSELNDNYTNLIAQQKSYLEQINGLVKRSNEQITALQKNNEIVNNEFSRRSKVEITFILKKNGGKLFLNKVEFVNIGDIECEMELFRFKIYSENYVCSDSTVKNLTIFVKNSVGTFDLKIHEIDTHKLNKGVTVFNTFQDACYFNSEETIIGYAFTYSNKYETNTITDIAKIKIE